MSNIRKEATLSVYVARREQLSSVS